MFEKRKGFCRPCGLQVTFEQVGATTFPQIINSCDTKTPLIAWETKTTTNNKYVVQKLHPTQLGQHLLITICLKKLIGNFSA